MITSFRSAKITMPAIVSMTPTAFSHSQLRTNASDVNSILSSLKSSVVYDRYINVSFGKQFDKERDCCSQSVARRINDAKPPGWRTLARDYGKWLRAGRDIRASSHWWEQEASRRNINARRTTSA